MWTWYSCSIELGLLYLLVMFQVCLLYKSSIIVTFSITCSYLCGAEYVGRRKHPVQLYHIERCTDPYCGRPIQSRSSDIVYVFRKKVPIELYDIERYSDSDSERSSQSRSSDIVHVYRKKVPIELYNIERCTDPDCVRPIQSRSSDIIDVPRKSYRIYHVFLPRKISEIYE